MRAHEDLQVVVDGQVVGSVRVAAPAVGPVDELTVLGAELLSPDDAATLGALLDCRAIAEGHGRILVEGDADALGLLAGAGWCELASQRLILDLGPAADAADSGVRLAPMGGEAYADFHDRLAEGYVLERAAEGESPEQARRTMLAQLGRLLPDGVESADQHLFTGWVDDVAVGHLWIGTENPEQSEGFVYFVEVAEEQRRRGHGSALMRAAAAWAREHGRERLALNVFAHNTAARGLYSALGYTVRESTYRRAL